MTNLLRAAGIAPNYALLPAGTLARHNTLMPRFKHTGKIPNSMIGEPVRFSAPGDVKKRGGKPVDGRIVDEVWELEAGPAPEAVDMPSEHHWGEYCLFSQLIEWANGGHSVRLGYYRRRRGESNWTFGSQTTISTDPETAQRLLTRTLAKSSWFERSPRAS